MSAIEIRIEKGEAADEELAALTVLLMTRAARPAPSDSTPRARGDALWRHHGFRAPNSWQG
ncbi:acyl-CoA carboxylase subunit epsilon [Streptomyces acidiscabies]|uniref:acyl-CoA carboxylase subunit epsilon n=1 Tax=Streptomyces acidiscabies TaxID=42234 RepID=UPI0038F6B4D5